MWSCYLIFTNHARRMQVKVRNGHGFLAVFMFKDILKHVLLIICILLYALYAGNSCSHLERRWPMFKSVLLLQKTVVWIQASFLRMKYISQKSIGYFKKGISVLKQCWHCSENVKKNENSHLFQEILHYHLKVVLRVTVSAPVNLLLLYQVNQWEERQTDDI